MNEDTKNTATTGAKLFSLSAFGIVIGLTLFSGVVHGYLDGRWSVSSDLKLTGERLGDLPSQCGDWILQDESELDRGASDMLRCYGSTVRTYLHRKSGESVKVAVLFGPRGPIAVHTPEVCYDSVGTTLVKPRVAETVQTPSGRHHLWSVQFARSPDPDPVVEVWYAWSDGGDFRAAKYPRFWMTENLYKIQLAGPVGVEGNRPCEDFLKDFLPSVEAAVQR